jgi:ribosomal 50S subunit-recycling heat shock protein
MRVWCGVPQDGRVTVNGERAQPALRLRGGDVLHLDGKVRPLFLRRVITACEHEGQR